MRTHVPIHLSMLVLASAHDAIVKFCWASIALLCPVPCRWVVPLLWLPLAAVLAVRACAMLPLPATAALAVAGVVLWQFIEYSMHRWLFHAVPSGPLAIMAHFLMHGCVMRRTGRPPCGLFRCTGTAVCLLLPAAAGCSLDRSIIAMTLNALVLPGAVWAVMLAPALPPAWHPASCSSACALCHNRWMLQPLQPAPLLFLHPALLLPSWASTHHLQEPSQVPVRC